MCWKVWKLQQARQLGQWEGLWEVWGGMFLGAKAFERMTNAGNPLLELRVLMDAFLDSFEAVDNGGMIPASERLPDLGQLKTKELPRQVHGDLTGNRNMFGSGF